MQYAIEIKNLCKQYPKFALQSVSFTLPMGYIMGFIGENGAGKEYRFAADPATHSETSCSGQLCFNLGLCGNHGRLCIAVNDCLAGHMGNCCSCNGHCSVGEYDLSALVCVFRQPESIDFCTAVDGFGRNWLFFYFRPDEWFPF